jgi:hypothetical protein
MSDDLKTEVPGLYKTPEGFLINKDNAALAAYKSKRNKFKEIKELKQDISALKEDMNEIKSLLRGLVK